MLLLHEALHHGSQGLTAESATMIRLAPKVLEELDYLADTWAMMHEFVIAGLATRDWSAQRAGLLQIIEAAVDTMWAFDSGSERGELEVRRVNRYLIWYVQLARIEQTADAPQAMRVLSEKPTIELIGPRVHLRDGRYVLALDKPSALPNELCFLDRQGQLRRVGTTNALSVADLAKSLGNHLGAEVRALVAGFIRQHS